jgi:predicted glycoside hydrolase/deacetylase ChbG (UPF0249 family)
MTRGRANSTARCRRSTIRKFVIVTVLSLCGGTSCIPNPRGRIAQVERTTRAERTLAEALGFAPSDRVLLIHADDLGLMSSVNEAARQLFANGLLGSGSVLIPAPAAQEIIDLAARDPAMDLGIHLTITSEWDKYKWRPMCGDAPSLVDGLGFLRPTTLQQFFTARTEDVEKEFRAQIEAALKMGLTPSHMDAHMGVAFVHPSFFRVYLDLAVEYRIFPLLPRSAILNEQIGAAGAVVLGWAFETFYERPARASGFPVLDHVVTQVDGVTVEERRRSYLELLKTLPPGITELLIHPALDDATFRRGVVASDDTQVKRLADTTIFLDPDTGDLIRALGIRLTTWRDIVRAEAFDGEHERRE